MKNKPIILGISGSIRLRSYNRFLIETAQRYIPPSFQFEVADLAFLPLYNNDLAVSQPPEQVEIFRQRIVQSAGLLIASPEYNYSFTGVLKNALDWASTNELGNALNEKPIGLMGASTSFFGSARSQLHLRQVLHAVNANVVRRPEVIIPKSNDKFSPDGKLIDQRGHKKIEALIKALVILIKI